MATHRRNNHAFTTRDADGRKREVRGQLFGKVWTISSRYADEEEWTIHEPPALDDLEELYGVLDAKYRRNRVSWDQMETLKKLIEAQRG